MTQEMSYVNFLESFQKLRQWIESQKFRGWDPYDALLSPFPWSLLGKWGEAILIQSLKRSPINFRPLLNIPQSLNPKTVGLLIHAYALIPNLQRDGSWKNTGEALLSLVEPLSSKGYASACWGYNFPWSSRNKRLPAWVPSSVVTGVMSRGLFAWHQQTGNAWAKDLVLQIPGFILHDLPRYEDKHGLSFSYTPLAKDICFNASLFAAESLANAIALGYDSGLKEVVRQAVDFVVHHQKPDGSWAYSINALTKRERMQLDFHQGFILDSIHHIMSGIAEYPPHWQDATEKGARFYFNQQFMPDGRSLRRLPRRWPADIHAQAQGIISFSVLKDLDPHYKPFAETIAAYTIRKMQSQQGYFHYQRYPLGNIRIPYMRWNQAWMMLALSQLLSDNQNITPSDRSK